MKKTTIHESSLEDIKNTMQKIGYNINDFDFNVKNFNQKYTSGQFDEQDEITVTYKLSQVNKKYISTTGPD